MMNMQEYVEQAGMTENNDFSAIRGRLQDVSNLRLLHGILGMVTEIGEFADQIKRHIFYGAPIDWTNLNEEIGDQMWYIALLSDIIDIESGSDLATACQKNIAKLQKRFPEKFRNFDAVNRNLDAEREVLEKRKEE